MVACARARCWRCCRLGPAVLKVLRCTPLIAALTRLQPPTSCLPQPPRYWPSRGNGHTGSGGGGEGGEGSNSDSSDGEPEGNSSSSGQADWQMRRSKTWDGRLQETTNLSDSLPQVS